MGKGARSREQNAEKKAQQKIKLQEESKKKKRDRRIIGGIAIVLTVAVVISGLVYGLYYGNGKYLRDKTVVTTENFKVDNAMMTYFFRNNFQSIQAGYSGYFEAFSGVKLDKSLKGQPYDETQSWFSYVLNSTKESLQQVLAAAEEAKAQGMELSEEDKNGIAKQVDALDASYFENGVSKEDIVRAMEISAIAQKYTNKFEEDTTYTDEQDEKYYSENENTYRNAGYLAYTINYEGEAEEGKVIYTKDQAKAKAEALEKATSADSFKSLVEAAVKEQEPAIEEAALTEKLDGVTVSNASYSEDSEVSQWVFDSARKAGDTMLKADEDNKMFSVYFLTDPAARSEAPTMNVRHILFTADEYGSSDKAKAKAEEILAKYQENPGEESFAKLATEYSGDAGSRSRGGLYTGVKEGAMVTEFNDWIFDSARTQGETAVVKTDYGYHLMYFVGKGKPEWQQLVEADQRKAAFDSKMEELKAKYAVTITEEPLQDIPA